MELSKENQMYDKQWDVVDTFYNTNEPEGFGDAVTTDEAKALKIYYFVNYKDKNVYEHRKRIIHDNPDTL